MSLKFNDSLSWILHIYADVYDKTLKTTCFIWICIYFLQFLGNDLAGKICLGNTLKQIKIISIESILYFL